METVSIDTWEKQPLWHGNPDLGYECYMKKFKVESSGRKVPVYLFGLPESDELTFCVSAGANSDLSYSGCFYPKKLTWQQSMNEIDRLYKMGKLIF